MSRIATHVDVNLFEREGAWALSAYAVHDREDGYTETRTLTTLASDTIPDQDAREDGADLWFSVEAEGVVTDLDQLDEEFIGSRRQEFIAAIAAVGTRALAAVA